MLSSWVDGAVASALRLFGSRSDDGDAAAWAAVAAFAGAPAPRLADSRERLRGAPTARVVLWRDSAAWCPFSMMTWLLLEEMGTPYIMKTVPLRGYMRPGEVKDAVYLAMVADGVVPGIQHSCDESGDFTPAYRGVYDIFDDLRERYSEYPLGNAEIHDAICGSGGLVGDLERAELYIGDPRENTKLVAALTAIEAVVVGPFACGDAPTAADCQLLPLLERIDAVAVYFYGEESLSQLPFQKCAALLAAARERKAFSYAQLRSDRLTLARIYASFDAPREPHADAAKIDGRCDATRREWLYGAAPAHKRAAAAKLAAKHAGIAAFALRSSGGGAASPCLGAALLAVATALAAETTSFEVDLGGRALDVYERHGAEDALRAVGALDALALLVGVPRDLDEPAANALRAACTTMARALGALCADVVAV
ncbi:hypothetical protein M885DRAFT_514378 [Pelagophyceae sp. CCMP2097]|nr:hypothetical protein M885DRAFT_514378 [Pelagophyceae sp. CCMP2097]|mmetsp:Transcript_31778/g.111879  ORF Transcript_31778/g.111879 Transcript_31778/m.111879 type:complete len:426 (-) Transcript_31778:53-1330(-)